MVKSRKCMVEGCAGSTRKTLCPEHLTNVRRILSRYYPGFVKRETRSVEHQKR